MIVEENLEGILNGLFPNVTIDTFSTDWILNNPRATEDSVRTIYSFLKGKGLKDNKIATQAHLLGRDPETIERNYQRLSALGLKDDKIASQAHLLGRDPETIERKYQSHVGLLRQNYQDRTSGRDLLTNQAQLLGISPETMNANVQFLYSTGIDYNDAFLLGTTPQLKRKKMAWMLRELFDYRNLPQDQKKEAIDGMYDFVRDNPTVLTKSINSMERTKEKLIERVTQYRR